MSYLFSNVFIINDNKTIANSSLEALKSCAVYFGELKNYKHNKEIKNLIFRITDC